MRLGRVLAIVVAAGLSLGVGAVVGFSYLWHGHNKAKPWDSTAIVASFVSAEEWDNTDQKGARLNGGMFWLRYALENRSDEDYRLSETDTPALMVKRRGDVFQDGGVTVHLPIFVPSRHRVVVTIQRSFSHDVFDDLAEIRHPKTVRLVPGLDEKSSRVFHDNFDDLSGIALFDSSHRYRIDLPRAW